MIKRLLANNIVLVLQAGVSSLIPMVLLPHIIQGIGLAAYGELAVALACASYATIVVQYAFQLTGPKRLAELEGEARSRFVALVFRSKLFLLACVTPLLWGVVCVMPSEVPWFPRLVLMLSFPVGMAFHAGWFLQASGRFGWVFAATALGTLCAVLLGLWGVQGRGEGSLLWASIALGLNAVIAGVGTFVASLRWLGAEPLKAGLKQVLAHLRQDAPLFVSQLTLAAYMFSGPIFVRYLSGQEEAGAYSMIERLANPLIAVCLLTHTAAYPQLVDLYGRQRAAFWRMLRFVMVAYLGLAGVMIAAILMGKSLLLAYLFKGALPVGIDALLGWALALLAVSIVPPLFTSYLTLSGRQREIFPLTLKMLVVVMLVGLPGICFFGAWAWMATLVLSQVVVLLYALKAWRDEKNPLVSAEC